jgi:hypothetical protein
MDSWLMRRVSSKLTSGNDSAQIQPFAKGRVATRGRAWSGIGGVKVWLHLQLQTGSSCPGPAKVGGTQQYTWALYGHCSSQANTSICARVINLRGSIWLNPCQIDQVNIHIQQPLLMGQMLLYGHCSSRAGLCEKRRCSQMRSTYGLLLSISSGILQWVLPLRPRIPRIHADRSALSDPGESAYPCEPTGFSGIQLIGKTRGAF